MTTVFLRNIFILTIFCLFSAWVYGQSDITTSESLTDLSDGLLKNEIASFTIKGNSFKGADTLIKLNLIEIPIKYCSDKEVHLNWSTFTSSVSTFIHLYFKGDTSNKTLDSIFLVTHSHFWVRIPDSAYKGLIQSNSCNFKRTGKSDAFYSPNYKAFYSADKRRLYIYMLGETIASIYEVTWVIINDKYFTRVLDNIQ